MEDDDLVAVCDFCLQPIPDGEGMVEVDIAAAERALKRWRARSESDLSAVFRTTSGARPAMWVTRHADCGISPRFAITIAVHRIRTWTDLLRWGVHLADKPYIQATDWHDLVERALVPRMAAVSGILPRRPRPLAGGPIGAPGLREPPAGE
ncbi:hypothetical protein ACFXKW_35850 [Streptomyces sp. NPDC059193]|uniref:hypothetical protein n=1 Tax=Streptomyces sp. NPDC059193 TaxID=3346763 RepID=UPI0036873D93